MCIETIRPRRSSTTIPLTHFIGQRHGSLNSWKTQPSTPKISHLSMKSLLKVRLSSYKRITAKRVIKNRLITVPTISAPMLSNLKARYSIKRTQKLPKLSETSPRKVWLMRINRLSFKTCQWSLIIRKIVWFNRWNI